MQTRGYRDSNESDYHDSDSKQLSRLSHYRYYRSALPYWHIIRRMRLYCTSTGKKYALIRDMRLIKSAFFNVGILRNAAKYSPISDMRLITRQYSKSMKNCVKED